MTVIGSYKNDRGFDPEVVKAMCHATTRASVDKIQELVAAKTPVGKPRTRHPKSKDTSPDYVPGALRESVQTTPTTHPYNRWYRAKVESRSSYVEWVEYGTPPHIIEPRNRKSLYFDGHAWERAIHHPGTEPVLMFSRGGAEFEHLWAERIAKANIRIFLGARTVT